jgi:type VI secretion system protein ImpE
MTIQDILAAGNLAEATEQVTARLKASPADTAARGLLAELLCLAGAFERAEAQLTTLAQQTVDRPMAIARLRHLVRAALAREAWFNTAAVPSLLREPTVGQRLAIALQVALKDDAADEVVPLLAEAEARRPKLTGSADGVPFDDFRDVDDRCAWFFEVMSNDGGYIWVDLATVEALRFTPPSRPIDLLWREAKLTFHNGATADIAVPAQYVDPQSSPEHRLAQRTDWRDGPGGAVFGSGQRLFLVGDDAKGLMDLTEIVFDRPAGA